MIGCSIFSAYYLPDFGRVVFQRHCLCPVDNSFQPAASSSPKWHLANNIGSEVLLEALGLFQAADKQQEIYIPLLCSVHLGQLSQESVLTLLCCGKCIQSRSSWSQGALLLKDHYQIIIAEILALHSGWTNCEGCIERHFHFFFKGSLFPAFLFRSSVWLVTHMWFSENGTSFRSLSYIQGCPIFLRILCSDLYFRWILLEDKHHTLNNVTSLLDVLLSYYPSTNNALLFFLN